MKSLDSILATISASKLDTWERCRESWRRRYIEGEKVPPGVAIHRGRGPHFAAKVNFEQKVDSHRDLPVTEMVELAVEHFRESVGRGISFTREEDHVGHDVVVGRGVDSVRGLAELFAVKVAPKYQPLLVEKRFTLTLPSRGYKLNGVVDWIAEGDVVTDLKTSARKIKDVMVTRSPQLTAYALYHAGVFGHLPRKVRLEGLIDKEVPVLQTLESTRTRNDVALLLRRIDAMVAGVRSGTFGPAPFDSWKCDPRFCGFYSTCPYVPAEGG